MKQLLYTTILISICLLLSRIAFAESLTFTCGNHNPKHSTGTFEEAKRLTMAHRCENWFIGSTDSSLGSEALKALRTELARTLEQEKHKSKTTSR